MARTSRSGDKVISATERFLEVINEAIGAIEMIKSRADYKPGATGAAECPVCGGRLLWSSTLRRGHIRARCQTEGCLAIME